MKNYFTLLIALAMALICFGQKDTQTRYANLMEVNREWQHTITYDKHQKIISFENDQERIQYHLSEVRDNLLARSTDHLSDLQKKNRAFCLNILDAYQKKAIFPQNLNHRERTPYFIDHENTHCAVGQLLNKTGYGDLALRIADENNNAYLKDLAVMYPELQHWAESYGFVLQELAWIQPSYLVCSDDCDQVVYGDVNSLDYEGPYTYLWSPSGETTPFLMDLCPGTLHTLSVFDVNGNEVLPEDVQVVFQATIYGNTVLIPENSQAQLLISTEDDIGNCSGSASFELTNDNDVMVTEILWDGVESNFNTASNLCAGWHTLEVETELECEVILEFFIEEYEEPSLSITAITNDTLCANQCINIEFETAGFPDNSMFGFQLSDENGVFDETSPITIGGSTSNPSGSTVSCAISADETGTGYRLRIINFDSGISQEFDQDLTVYVVDYEVVSSPGILEVITDIPETTYLWSNCPGNSIAEETEAQFTNGIDGNEYFVNLMQNGCPTHSFCLPFEVATGIEEASNFDISVFPNPSHGRFNIKADPNIINGIIQIRDMVGRMVYRKEFSDLSQTEIILDDLSGLYYMELRSGMDLFARIKLVLE